MNNRTERQTIAPRTWHVKHIHLIVPLRLLPTPKQQRSCAGKRHFCTLLLVFHIKPLVFCELPAVVCIKTQLRHAKFLVNETCSSVVLKHRPALDHVNEQWPFINGATDQSQTWSISSQMSQKSRLKSGFQRILKTLAAHQVAQVNAGLFVQPCMKPEGLKRRRNFRTLSLSCSFVVGSLQVRSCHSSARWQNVGVTEGSKQLRNLSGSKQKILVLFLACFPNSERPRYEIIFSRSFPGNYNK